MNFKNWTFGKKLWFLTFTSLIILVVIEISNTRNTNALTEKLMDMGHNQLTAVRSMTLADMMHDGIRAVVFRGLLASYNQDYKEFQESKTELEEFSKNIVQYLGDIKKLDVNDDVKKQIDDSNNEVQKYLKAGHDVMALLEAAKIQDAKALVPEFQSTFTDLEGKFEKLGDTIESNAQASVTESEKTASHASQVSLIFAVVGFLLFLGLSAFINFELLKTLGNMTQQLEAQGNALKLYTDEMNSSASGLSSSSTQQASAVQETAAALEEINAMVSKTSENSQKLDSSSRSSQNAVDEGRSAIANMLSEMDTIMKSNGAVMTQIDDSNGQIKKIVQLIGEIGERTKVINDIVFQTKLLSFNASVEAARAGQHGKGFAVVAEEVGKLAQMSGTASKEITDMLDNGIKQVNEIVESNQSKIGAIMQESTSKVQRGKVVAEQCGEVFEKIVVNVGDVTRLSSEIAMAIKEQTTGLEEIGNAMNLFSKSTQENSTTAQSTTNIAQSLRESFNELAGLVIELKSLTKGKNHSEASSVMPSQKSQTEDVDYLKQSA